MSTAQSSLDPLVARTLDAHTLQKSQPRSRSPTLDPDSDSDSDTDSLLASLSDDPVFAAHRAARLQQLSTALSAQKTLLASSHGVVTTLGSEKEIMDIVTSTKQTLCHFYHSGFHRCAAMDRLLEGLCAVHFEVRFLRVEAGKAEWLCGRLGVRVLPCLVGWVDGAEVGRVVGFEGVRRGERSGVGGLEEAMVERGMLVRIKIGDNGSGGGGNRKEQKVEDEEDGDEWD